MPELTDICLSCTVAMVILALLPGLLLLRLAWDDGAAGLFAMGMGPVKAPVERCIEDHTRARAALSKLGSRLRLIWLEFDGPVTVASYLSQAVPGWVSPRRLI